MAEEGLSESTNQHRNKKFYDQLGPYDVLLGRGTGPNENQGNKFFRDMLHELSEAYRSAKSRKEKKAIVLKAMEHVKAKGGKFLEKVVHASSIKKQGAHTYEEVDYSVAFLKTRQAFRYALQGIGSCQEKQSTQSQDDGMHDVTKLPKPSTPFQSSGRTNTHLPAIHDIASPFARRFAASREPILGSSLPVSPFPNMAGISHQSSPLSISDNALVSAGFLSSPRARRLPSSLIRGCDPSLMLQASGRPRMRFDQDILLSSQISPFATRATAITMPNSPMENALLGGHHDAIVRLVPDLVDEVLLSPLDDLTLRSASTPQTLASARGLSHSAITEQLALHRAMQVRREEEKRRRLARIFSPKLEELKRQERQKQPQLKGLVEQRAGGSTFSKTKTNLHQRMVLIPGEGNVFNKIDGPTKQESPVPPSA